MVLALTLSLNAKVWAHGGEEQKVVIEPESSGPWTAGTSDFRFQLFNTEANTPIEDKDLVLSHTKKLHLVIYDESLREFYHVHPEFKSRTWVVQTDVIRNGKYWVWAQGELINNGGEFSSSAQVTVTGGQAAWPTPAKLTEVRTGSDGVSTVSLAATTLTAKSSAMVDLVIGRNDGTKPNVSPYLGAFAHVIATPIDGDSLIHVHPMAGTKPNEGMLHVTFPDKGMYRLWVQFIDGGLLRTVPLAVKVK